MNYKIIKCQFGFKVNQGLVLIIMGKMKKEFFCWWRNFDLGILTRKSASQRRREKKKKKEKIVLPLVINSYK